MRKHKAAKPRDLDALRSAAKAAAYRIAEADGCDPKTVRHMTDSQYDRTCFVATEDEAGAVVVYDDEPEVKFYIQNFPGRLQQIAAAE